MESVKEIFVALTILFGSGYAAEMTKTHLQAVDAEVVFTALTLPHETLLLPFKTVGYEFAGIGALVSSKEHLTQEQIQQIVLGYWDLFSVVSNKKTEIDETLAGIDFSKIPIRVIIRNTSEYRNLLNDLVANTLPSEVEQMNRGDVPFYFKFVSNKNLFWKVGSELIQIEESVGIFRRDIDRHGKYESEGLDCGRTSTPWLVQGLLFILKHFDSKSRITLGQQGVIEGKRAIIGHQVFDFQAIRQSAPRI